MSVDAFWIFIFRNDKDVTSDLLGLKNLIPVHDGIISLPLSIVKGSEVISTISVLGIDAGMIDSDSAKNSNYFVSTSIVDQENERFIPYYVPTINSKYDPAPKYISYTKPKAYGKENIAMIVSLDDEYDEINLVAIDFKQGIRMPMDCGSFKNPGIISFKGPINKGTISSQCSYPKNMSANDTVFAITTDYFAATSDNHGAFGSIFSRMLVTH